MPHNVIRSRTESPELPDVVVDRARLLDMLDRGARGSLTVVSAPAGTGKTVVVTQWLASRHLPGPLIWISLAQDADATQLWARLASAVRHAPSLDANDVPDPSAGFDDFLTHLASAIAASPEPVVLILDCLQELPVDAAGDLHELLVASVGQLRLITLSRAEPQLPLHLYRLNESLIEIRTADLAFTGAEASELLKVRGFSFPPDVVDELLVRTRGWVTGVLAAATSLARSDGMASHVNRFDDNGAESFADYLVTEMLEAQTPTVRDLLMRTCVVDCLRPGLIEVLAGPHAPRAMAALTRENVLMEELPDSPGWYSYNPVFRELLESRLIRETPAKATRLHIAAARWFAAQGLMHDAVSTAAEVDAWDEAARLVVENLGVTQLLSECGGGDLQSLFSDLPHRSTSTAILLVRAALALNEQDYEACSDLLNRAKRKYAKSTDFPRAHLLTFEVLSSLRAARAAAPVDEVVAVIARARRLLESDDAAPGTRELLVLLQDTAAEVLLADGRLSATATACRRAISASDGELLPGQVTCMGRLALIAAFSGFCRRAIRLGERADALQRTTPVPSTAWSALPSIALAWAYTETGEISRAADHVSVASRIATQLPWLGGGALVRAVEAVVRARIRRARGDLARARTVLADALSHSDELPAWLNDQLVAEQARGEILRGRDRAALELTESLSCDESDAVRLLRTEVELICGDVASGPDSLPVVRARDDLLRRVEKALLEALHAARRRDDRSCAEAIERALRLAAAEHLRRPFRESAEPVRNVLAARSDLTARHPWLADEQSTSHPDIDEDHENAMQQAPVIEPLTDKERQVLTLLSQLLTTEETAAAMFVSVNTVRTHVRNILRKMGVAGRNEAIRRAWDLGMLSAA
jgi:LuxR family maltose regulon positive regulatory protein